MFQDTEIRKQGNSYNPHQEDVEIESRNFIEIDFHILSMRDSIFLLFHTMMKFIKIRDVQAPTRAHPTDAGIDFFIPNSFPEDFEIKITWSEVPLTTRVYKTEENKWTIMIRPGQWVLIPSWIKVIIEPWYDMTFHDKSWFSTKKNMLVWAKVVDSSYRWEVHIHFINCSDQVQEVHTWDKVIQWIVRWVVLCTPEEISDEEFNNESNTDRGAGGFWSTGS